MSEISSKVNPAYPPVSRGVASKSSRNHHALLNCVVETAVLLSSLVVVAGLTATS